MVSDGVEAVCWHGVLSVWVAALAWDGVPPSTTWGPGLAWGLLVSPVKTTKEHMQNPASSLTGFQRHRILRILRGSEYKRWWINKLWETFNWATNLDKDRLHPPSIDDTAEWVESDCLEDTPLDLHTPKNESEFLLMLNKHDENTLRRVLCISPHLDGEVLSDLITLVNQEDAATNP